MKQELKTIHFAFQISRMVIFEVSYYRCGNNKTKHFSTSAAEFNRPKTDYKQGGQAQKELLPIGTPARKFFDKWDTLHLKDLTSAQHEKILNDIDELKGAYNWLQGNKEQELSFWELKTFSMQKVFKPAAPEANTTKPETAPAAGQTLYVVKLKEGHGAREEHIVNGYLGNCFGNGKVQTYTRGEAIKKARYFGGKIEKAPETTATTSIFKGVTPIEEMSIEQLRKEVLNLREAMAVIRFLSFKHAEQYWLDASGSSDDRLQSILKLARTSNWAHDSTIIRTVEIKLKHTY